MPLRLMTALGLTLPSRQLTRAVRCQAVWYGKVGAWVEQCERKAVVTVEGLDFCWTCARDLRQCRAVSFKRGVTYV